MERVLASSIVWWVASMYTYRTKNTWQGLLEKYLSGLICIIHPFDKLTYKVQEVRNQINRETGKKQAHSKRTYFRSFTYKHYTLLVIIIDTIMYSILTWLPFFIDTVCRSAISTVINYHSRQNQQEKRQKIHIKSKLYKLHVYIKQIIYFLGV